MTAGCFSWNGRSIPFRDGESIAAALTSAGILNLGRDALGGDMRYFCGVGACQNCLIRVDGIVREACLAPARAGLAVRSVGSADA